eukprot:SAG22_NODE_4687_length_1192_cov_1.612992_2_plen_195_part_00
MHPLLQGVSRSAAPWTDHAHTGWVTLVGTLSEYFPFFFSRRLIARLRPARLMLLSQLAMIVRLLAVSTVQPGQEHRLVAIQSLHGLGFACYWIAVVEHVQQAAAPALRGTSQSVVSTCYYTLGPGLGSILWLSLYELYGARWVYRAGCLVAAGNAAAMVALSVPRSSSSSSSASRRKPAPSKASPSVGGSSNNV